MSYLFPMNGTEIGIDRFEPTCYQGVRPDDEGGEQAEREPLAGGLRTGRGEMRSTIEEMREFRRAKPERCEHDERDRDERADRDDRDGRDIEPERGPRRPL